MPRHPALSPTLSAISGSVYSKLAQQLATHQGTVYPLHVGDTWMEPPAGCRMEDFRVADHPGMHRYTAPQGHPALLAAVAVRVAERSGVPTTPDNVLIAAGATGALGAALGALAAPGDEVLLLSPYWPLISGIVRSFHGTPVPVPVLGCETDPAAAVDAVERRRSGRTVALYLNTPNNPTGRVIPRAVLQALVAWAAKHDLWVIADEVYEDYQFAGAHSYTRPLDPERTFAAHSFSKAYGMAGNRCGYVVGPAATMGELRKVATHTFYSTPTASQLAALAALGEIGDTWVAAAREQYRDTGAWAAARLGVATPQGSTFLFLDVAPWLTNGGDGLDAFLGRCADRGLFLAPGPSFGPFPTHVRLCYTAAPPERVREGVAVLAELLGR
ncbi:MAG TPA: pyridoxal phosphate-dependent aminotransferase [Thermoanaerobaculia bacterium]|nr:pyridoxal phosphate-dependent aminotransferase [Thermoanaerobaculia bacterium]